MKSYKKFLILFLISFLIISISNNVNATNKNIVLKFEKEENNIVVTTKHAILFIEKDYLSEKEIYQIAQKIETGINKIKNYLPKDYIIRDLSNFKIRYDIKSGKFISSAGNGYVRLSFVKEGWAPYIHETVHAISIYNNNRKWLSEGLAVYLNDKLNGYPSFPNYGKDLDKLSKQIINSKKYKDVITFKNKFTTSLVGQKKRKAFYTVSGSLVKYLLNEYGKEKVLKLLLQHDSQDVLKKDFKEIKKEWVNHINNIETNS